MAVNNAEAEIRWLLAGNKGPRPQAEQHQPPGAAAGAFGAAAAPYGAPGYGAPPPYGAAAPYGAAPGECCMCHVLADDAS